MGFYKKKVASRYCYCYCCVKLYSSKHIIAVQCKSCVGRAAPVRSGRCIVIVIIAIVIVLQNV